jgi:hypothetical protein
MSVKRVIQTGAVDAEVGPVGALEQGAQVLQGGIRCGADLGLGHQDSHRLPVLEKVEGPHTLRVMLDAVLGLLAHLRFGKYGAGRRVPAWEVDIRRFADRAPPAVAADQPFRPK